MSATQNSQNEKTDLSSVSTANSSDWKRIGAKGAGKLYTAQVLPLHEKVTIKKIAKKHQVSPLFYARFKEEAIAVSALDHPNIATIYGLNEDRDALYICMEHIDGFTLEQILSWRPFPQELVLLIILQILKGLRFAHQKQVYHCNVNPANCHITRSGQVVLADFGIAHSMVNALTATAAQKENAPMPPYMSLEQSDFLEQQRHLFFHHNDAIPVFSNSSHAFSYPSPLFAIQNDLWSASAILYHSLAPTGVTRQKSTVIKLYTSDNRFCRILKLAPTLPDDLAMIIDSWLAPDPKKRPVSIEPIIPALENYLNDLGIQEPEEEIRRFLADPGSVFAVMEKKVTDYHLRKGKEFLASGNERKSTAHFNAAKSIVFDPFKKDQPISLFPGQSQGNNPPPPEAASLSGGVSRTLQKTKDVVETKAFKPVAGILAFILVAAIGTFLFVSTLQESISKREAAANYLQQDIFTPSALPVPADSFGTATSAAPQAIAPEVSAPGRDSAKAEPTRLRSQPRAKRTDNGNAALPDNPLKPQWNEQTSQGILSMTIEPFSAWVTLDNMDAVSREELAEGKKLPVGTHTINVRAEGYQSFNSEVTITKNTTTALMVNLKRVSVATGRLHVYSNPWAELYIDGAFQGTTPTPTLISLSSGNHTILLVRKGFITHSESVNIGQGEEKRLQITLEKE